MTESLPKKREYILVDKPFLHEEPPSIKLYAWLIAFAILLLFSAFILSKPDWPGFFLNLATEIIGAVIILALVERKLRTSEIEHLKNTASNFQGQIYFLLFPNRKRLADYLEKSSAKFNQLALDFYMQRPELEQRLRNEKGSFILSGAGGTGKTTELQRLYLGICKKTIFNLSKGKVPVFMPSRWMNPDIEFVEDTLRLHFERDSDVTEKQVDGYLKSSRIIIFVDGLDELEQEQRKKVCQVLDIFKRKWPSNQLVVSTREYDSEAIANELGMNIVRIAKLTDEEVAHLSKIYEQYRMKKT